MLVKVFVKHVNDDQTTLCIQNCSSIIVLATTLVRIETSSTNDVVVKALRNTFSHVSFIIVNYSKSELFLSIKTHILIAGVDDALVKNKGVFDNFGWSKYCKHHSFIISRKISSPDMKENVKSYVLADPNFDICGPIDAF